MRRRRSTTESERRHPRAPPPRHLRPYRRWFRRPHRQRLSKHPIRGPQKVEGIPLQDRHEYADNQDVSRKRGRPARLAAGATSRHSIRLRSYDYSYPGAYFVPVCTARRELLFGWISDGRVVENANASIVRDCWLDLPNHYPHISLDAFVVMPDHIHGIIVLLDTHSG